MTESQKSSALVDEVLKDARTKADRIVKKAEREAKKVSSGVLEEVEGEIEQIASRAEDDAARVERKLMAVVPLEMRRIKLAEQEKQVDRVLDAAREQVAGMTGQEHREMLLDWAVEALGVIRAEAITLSLSPEDAKVAGDDFVDRLTDRLTGNAPSIEVETRDGQASPGLVLTSADGHEVVDNTLPERFRRMRPALRDAVVEQLFDTGDPTDKTTQA